MTRKLRPALNIVSDIGALGFDLQHHTDAEIADAVTLLRTVNPEMFDWIVKVLQVPTHAPKPDILKADGLAPPLGVIARLRFAIAAEAPNKGLLQAALDAIEAAASVSSVPPDLETLRIENETLKTLLNAWMKRAYEAERTNPHGEPVDPVLMEPYYKEMREKTIPAIVEAVRARGKAAGESIAKNRPLAAASSVPPADTPMWTGEKPPSDFKFTLPVSEETGLVSRLEKKIKRFRALGGIPDMCDMAWKLCCENESLRAELSAFKAAASFVPPKHDWQPIETAPERRKVLVTWVNALGKRRTTMATFWPVGTLSMGDDCSDDDVDEEGRNVHAAWFEESEANDETYYRLTETLTHWMPLPLPPSVDPSPADRKSE